MMLMIGIPADIAQKDESLRERERGEWTRIRKEQRSRRRGDGLISIADETKRESTGC